MSLKLWVASRWLPEGLLRRELALVTRMTVEALDRLVAEASPGPVSHPPPLDIETASNLAEMRRQMALAHNVRAAVLVTALGEAEAVTRGRAALFKAGLRLGEAARSRLGVGEGMLDLLNAARVLYRVLGIDFAVEKGEAGRSTLVVRRCALADVYTPVTCRVLSAADEGVVRGLNPRVKMTFTERITAGAPGCRAGIEFR